MLNDKILTLLQRPEVSDLHITEGSAIWFRDAGKLKREDGEPITREDIHTWMASIQDDTNIPIDTLPKKILVKGDLDFSAQLPTMRVRGNIFLSDKRFSMVLRRLNSKIPKMEDMDLPLQVVELIGRSKGIMLVTGATGSGKSTTLAAILQYLNENTRSHIITIEDPIEYKLKDAMSHISQRQIGPDASSFGNALRAALRQDPDILLIGELRDQETVKTALDAANTGHLVFGTLHTNNARQSIERLTSFFAAEEKEWAQQVISSVLLGVMSQVLVPKATGQGRQLCSELMVNTSAAAQCIRDGKLTHLVNIMEMGSTDGQQTLNNDLKRRLLEGQITTEDALYYSYAPGQLQKELSDDY